MGRNREQEIRDLEDPAVPAAEAGKRQPVFTFGGVGQPPKIRRSSIWDGLMSQIEGEPDEIRVMVWRKWTLGSEAEARSAQQAVKQRLTAPEGQRYKTRVSGCELYVRLVPEAA